MKVGRFFFIYSKKFRFDEVGKKKKQQQENYMVRMIL